MKHDPVVFVSRLRPSGLFTRLAVRPHVREGERVLVSVVSVGLVSMLGLLDHATPMVLSLAVFYVLLVVAATMLSGLWSGLVTAVASAAAWAFGDAGIGLHSRWTYLLNGLLRFLALAVVVFLVWRLRRALAASQESDRRSRDFLAVAAHQLRTPIAGLGASADALLCAGASPLQEQLLGNLSSESARAGRLIAALLRMARLDQGEPLRLDPVGVERLVASELERVAQLCSLECTLFTTGEIPPVVLLDEQATRDALANVLDNARRSAISTVQVRVRRRWDTLLVEVHDDGPGLPAGSEERAFERFTTLDGQGGSGLGLPIARGLLRLQGGDLVYAGKAFVLSLPLNPRSSAHGTAASRTGGRRVSEAQLSR